MQVLLVRRSDFRPQRMIGVVGQKWRTSGYHYGCVSGVYLMENVKMYLVEDVLERVGTVDGEAYEEEVCLWIR